jgi:anti-sigma factor ChrR (cupin superfamily)
MPENSLNGDLSIRADAETATMDWTPSPSGTVWRKRLHRVGPAESGQVTSVVRYDPDSQFPPHDHPQGEEILVLEGVFSDEHGDWPAGTYLLNPEGFRHQPFSREGCVLLVKLRQYPGTSREQLQVRSQDLEWQTTNAEGRSEKQLYQQQGYSDRMRLERWAAHAEPGILNWPDGVEFFVIDGVMADREGVYEKGCWLRLPPGTTHEPCSERGCELYIKEGGFTYLQQGQDLVTRPSSETT